jgi:hypothetical protein
MRGDHDRPWSRRMPASFPLDPSFRDISHRAALNSRFQRSVHAATKRQTADLEHAAVESA